MEFKKIVLIIVRLASLTQRFRRDIPNSLYHFRGLQLPVGGLRLTEMSIMSTADRPCISNAVVVRQPSSLFRNSLASNTAFGSDSSRLSARVLLICDFFPMKQTRAGIAVSMITGYGLDGRSYIPGRGKRLISSTQSTERP
jgi:hypothetical protein